MKNLYLLYKFAIKDQILENSLEKKLQLMEDEGAVSMYVPIAYVTSRSEKFDEVSKILNIEIRQERIRFPPR